jgi:hypothetical protein
MLSMQIIALAMFQMWLLMLGVKQLLGLKKKGFKLFEYWL